MGTWLAEFWQGLSGDLFDGPSPAQVGQIVGRMFVAATLGGVIGYERECKGKAAGMRTHMLVALASAFFVIIAQQDGMAAADLSRVIQGLAAGVGFLGAGAILKHNDNVIGLTTAASLYFTTAVGIAAGLGRETPAILGTVLALIVLILLPGAGKWFERRLSQTRQKDDSTDR